MRESRTYGFVRGARGNSRPYRVRAILLRVRKWPTLPVAAGWPRRQLSGLDRTWIVQIATFRV